MKKQLLPKSVSKLPFLELIKNQRENNARLLVFAHNDNDTCKFYDELQYLNYDLVREDGREVIMFKLKSLVRFNTEQN